MYIQVNIQAIQPSFRYHARLSQKPHSLKVGRDISLSGTQGIRYLLIILLHYTVLKVRLLL